MNEQKLLRRRAAAFLMTAALMPVCRCLLAPFMDSGQLLSLLLYVQTGRSVSAAAGETKPTETHNFTTPTQITQSSQPQQEPEAVLSFSYADLDLIRIRYNCDYRPDTQALLEAPLELSLTGEEPTVLILHSHASESYTGDFDYVEYYRSLDPEENMLAVGDRVAQVLRAGGITVLHDRTLHDQPDYNSAYSSARAAIQSYLAEYPTIQIVLDLHRDATASTGNQLVTAATVNGQRSAQLMMVVGTDAGGSYHPDWQENLALALKLGVLLEQENPGICRPVSLRSSRFNIDLSTGSLLVEVGAAGNTLEEALIAADALGNALVQLANGSR